jgi:hypothetical protein
MIPSNNDIITRKKSMKPIQWIRKQLLLTGILEQIYTIHTKVCNLISTVERLDKSLQKSQKLPAYITIQDGDRTFVTKLCWLGPGESQEVWIQPDTDINKGALVTIFEPFYMSQVREATICLVGNYPDMTRECKFVEKITPSMRFIAVINYPVPDGD